MFAIIEKTHYTTWRSVSFGLKAHPAHKINARHTNKSGTTAFVPTNCADDCNVFSITLCLCSRVAAVALTRINFQLASPATRMPFWLMQDEPLIHSHLCQISIHRVCSVRYRKRNFPSDIIGAENALVRNQAEIFSVNGRLSDDDVQGCVAHTASFKLPPSEKSRPATNKVFRFMNAHQSLPRRSSAERLFVARKPPLSLIAAATNTLPLIPLTIILLVSWGATNTNYMCPSWFSWWTIEYNYFFNCLWILYYKLSY